MDNKDKTDSFCQIVEQQLDVGNIIMAVTALKEASELLVNDEKEISDSLLLISRYLIKKFMLNEQNIKLVKAKIDELKSNG